jgi:hypothetical protein
MSLPIRSRTMPALVALVLSAGCGVHPSAPRSPSPLDGSAPHLEVDVLVYGATSAGVIAAYTARQYGRSVLLVEPGRHLGGMSSGGLGHTDIGNKFAVTGLGLDFYRRLGRFYGGFEAWQFEPRAAAQVFKSYVDEAGVEVLFSRRLADVHSEGTRIRRVRLEYAAGGARAPDLVVGARQFIDATYEGDLFAMAGASYTVGREDNSRFGETLNGVQMMAGHQFPDGVDPYVVPGDASSGLLPEITGVGVEPTGTGDRKVQAYNFRMTLCQGEQSVGLPHARNYDPARYELLIRLLERRPWRTLNDGFIISRMPNGKTDWNNRGGFSSNQVGRNWEYPEADYARRAAIWGEHEDYQKGLLHFIATDPRIPAHIRDEMRSWGTCRDEFLDTAGWPHQLYVREARRLVGEHVMTEHNARGRDVVEDGVGLAAYTMDSHNVQRVVVDGMVRNEGNVEVGGFPPYPIAYRSLIPKRAEVTNLLVPVMLSATHIVYGSIRMEPVYMVLAQASAVAASMAIDGDLDVQDVDVARLQRELRENPLADGSVAEVLVDDGFREQVRVSGGWQPAEIRGRYGPTVLRSVAGESGSVRFLPRFVEPGRYTVYLYWPRAEGLATDVPVEIRHAAGTERVRLNMNAPLQGSLQHGIAQWVPLGTFAFETGRDAWLELHSEGVDGSVLADAVLFVPVRGSR